MTSKPFLFGCARAAQCLLLCLQQAPLPCLPVTAPSQVFILITETRIPQSFCHSSWSSLGPWVSLVRPLGIALQPPNCKSPYRCLILYFKTSIKKKILSELQSECVMWPERDVEYLFLLLEASLYLELIKLFTLHHEQFSKYFFLLSQAATHHGFKLHFTLCRSPAEVPGPVGFAPTLC